MMQKPLILKMDEAKQELIRCINNMMHQHGLSCYLIEPMLADIYSQVKVAAQNELAAAREHANTESVVDTVQND